MVRLVGFVVAIAVVSIGNATTRAQSYTLDMTDVVADPDGWSYVRLLNDAEIVTGYRFGVCIDDTQFETTGLDYWESTFPSPDFLQLSVVSGGWTCDAILTTTPGLGIEPHLGHHYLVVASYLAIGTVTRTSFCFCDSLGTPAMPIEIDTATETVTPSTECADIVVYGSPFWELDLIDRDVYYRIGDPVREFGVDIAVRQIDGPESLDVQGMSMGVEHDPALLEAVNVEPAGVLADIYGFGSPGPLSAEFWSWVVLDNGFTLGAVYGGFNPVDYGSDWERIIAVTYRTRPELLTGAAVDSTLQFVDDLGTPRVAVVLVSGGQAYDVGQLTGQLSFAPTQGALFRRGDCNDDGSFDIADGVTILSELFAGGSPGPCRAACDINADLTYDIADPVYIFNYLLLGGPEPTPPFDECDGDGAPWPCDSYTSCL